MRSPVMLAVLATLALWTTCGAVELTVTPVSEFYLPATAGGQPEFGVGAGEQLDYDSSAKLAYVIGETGMLNVVHYPNYTSPELVDSVDVGNTGTDVEVCTGATGPVAAVGIQGLANKQANGTIKFYQGWTEAEGIPLLYEITVGPLPDQISFSKDCKVMVIANEGEAGVNNGQFENPAGSVTVLKWADGDLTKQPEQVTLGFEGFNGEEMYKADGTGVLWSYRPGTSVNGTQDSFMLDLEPEYVAITDDASMAYVILQENNAVAFVSLGDTPKVEGIAPLGLKDWSSLTMDASNTDSVINMVQWPIFGAYMPDTIKTFSSGGKNYLVTANEGDAKEYLNADESEFWIEEIRGADITNFADSVSQEMRDSLSHDTSLGRLKFLSRHGLDENGNMAKFIAMGGRSASIFEMTDDFQAVLVWDSGDEIERKHAEMDPDGILGLFNPEQDEADQAVFEGFDQRSDDKGIETETVELAMCGGAHLLFVGNERSSALTIYDITDVSAPVMVDQIAMANPTGRQDVTWGALHAERAVGAIDPESMVWVSTDDNSGYLMVAGAVSGTIATYKIDCEGSEAGTPPPADDSAASPASAFSVVILLMSMVLAALGLY